MLVPFENVPRLAAASQAVMSAVEAGLRERGYDVVAGAPVEEFLQAHRIRYLDALPAGQRGELLDKFEASAVIAGSILVYDSAAEPFVAVAARLVARDGAVLWSHARGITAADTQGAFGAGAVHALDDVARRAVADLCASVPPGDPGAAEARAPAPRSRGVRVFRSERLRDAPLKIRVLPLDDWTAGRDVARVVDAVLQDRLRGRPGLTLVDPADARRGVLAARVRAPSRAPMEALRGLADRVGTSLFLTGSVFAYTASFAAGSPEVELYLALVDAKTEEMLWSGLLRRSGRDYQGLLQLGTIRDPVSLASAVAGELVTAFTSY